MVVDSERIEHTWLIAFSSDFSKTWDSKCLGLKYTTNSELSHFLSVSLKGIQKSFMVAFPSLFPVKMAQSCQSVEPSLCVHTLAAVAPKGDRDVSRGCGCHEEDWPGLY